MGEKRRQRCSVEGCRAWSTASGLCAGHDPEMQIRARRAVAEKERSLRSLPELTDTESAERWIGTVGRLLAAGHVTELLARELRMIGKDFAAVHQGRLATQEFEALKRRVDELAARESWRG